MFRELGVVCGFLFAIFFGGFSQELEQSIFGHWLWHVWDALLWLTPPLYQWGQLGHRGGWWSLLGLFCLLLDLVFYVIVPWRLVSGGLEENWEGGIECWHLITKTIYVFLALAIFQSVIEWSETLDPARQANTTWLYVFTFAAYIKPAVRFWLQFAEQEEARKNPPAWVGDADECNWRYEFWVGFTYIVVKVGNWWINRKVKANSDAFGEDGEATNRQIEKAGLV